MVSFKYSASLAVLAQLLSVSTASKCKAAPGSHDWPAAAEWKALNRTLAGRLLQPPPPGAVCHPGSPTYNAAICPALQTAWLTALYHTEQPLNSLFNNFNNDTCLPDPAAPCSGEGYPVYVINATSANDVKIGVDFARKTNVRLIVKNTGHDYLGRSSAPNSLSIWTHNLKSLTFHEKSFKPKGCKFSIETTAITAGSGSQFGDIDLAASNRNWTVVSGGAATVGIGGYFSGGGHSALSATWGLAADNVLEMEMVTPGGDIITINECQNQDLFWAMRGGGGSTFGVMTSATMKARPAPTFLTVDILLGTQTGNPSYWSVVAAVLKRLPALNDMGIAGYGYIYPNYTVPGNAYPWNVDAFAGTYLIPVLSPANTSASLTAAWQAILDNVTAAYPGQYVTSATPHTWPDFWAWYQPNNGPMDAGYDSILGSRLLAREHVQNETAVAAAFKAFTPQGGVTITHLVSGAGVRDAKPRGGSDSANPLWRKTLLHVVAALKFPPLDPVAKKAAADAMTDVYVPALRRLAPDMGAYSNEADINEPNFQQSFWGSNYARLLKIKRSVDPGDVFWCHPCVGNEKWEVVDDLLCRK